MRTSRALASLWLAFAFVTLFAGRAQAWRSALYPSDWQPPVEGVASFETNKLIQDFSYAGYRAGEQNLPDTAGPVFNVTAPPYNADNSGVNDATLAIQSAINAAQTAGGGVVFLPAGHYPVSVQGANAYALLINASNVVMRGAGTNSTFLLNTSTNMRSKSIILVNGPSAAGFYSSGSGNTLISRDLTGPTVAIPVTSTASFAVGQWVVVRADCTDAWITEHNEPDWLGHGSELRGVAYLRRVTAVNPGAGTITIDVPTRYYLKTRDNARVVRLSSGPLIGCALENFSIGNVQHNGSGWGENDYTITTNAAYAVHDSFAIRLVRARECWVRNVATFQTPGNTTTCHLLSNGTLLNECTQVTLTNCDFQRPQYGGGGGNGYMYRLSNSSDCLVDNCRSTFTRHAFVLSSMAASGNVFHRCIDKDSGHQTGDTGSQSTAGANSDHHMHFSHANLVDACTGDNSVWEARYRPYGSVPLHDLTAAHSVFWSALGVGGGPTYVVQSEQSRYGYVIGTRGTRSGVSLSNYGGTKCDPADHVEGVAQGDTLEPASLYEDQLDRRLQRPHIILPANVTLGFPTNSVQLQPVVQIGSQDAPTNSFTVEWRVISAPGVVLFSSTNSVNPWLTFAARGTNEIEMAVTANGYSTTARVSVLLASDNPTGPPALTPVADTYVRDGSFANDNYGLETALSVKKNSVAGYTRRAFLRFDLSGTAASSFDRAFLELHSPSPPAAGSSPQLELRFVPSDVWSETASTWNTQPPPDYIITSWPMSTNGVDRVEISSTAMTEAAGDGLLSLELLIANPISDTVYSFNSREASVPVRPQLVFEKDSMTFTEWIAGYTNLPASESDPADNPDADNLNNAEEFLFARDPGQPENSAVFTITPVTGAMLLGFPQRKHLPSETYYVIETTSSLPSPWLPATGVEFNKVGDLGSAWLMNARVGVASPTQGFYRLRIVIGL